MFPVRFFLFFHRSLKVFTSSPDGFHIITRKFSHHHEKIFIITRKFSYHLQNVFTSSPEIFHIISRKFSHHYQKFFTSSPESFIIIIIIMAFRQIPTMTKSHHGGNLSLMAMVGFCHQHIPTMMKLGCPNLPKVSHQFYGKRIVNKICL